MAEELQDPRDDGSLEDIVVQQEAVESVEDDDVDVQGVEDGVDELLDPKVEDITNAPRLTRAQMLATPTSNPASDLPEDQLQGLPKGVKVSEDNYPMNLKGDKEADPENRYVRYTGIGTVRHITPEDWDAIGIQAEHAEWSYLNDKKLPLSRFTPAQLQYLLRVDGRFELVKG